MARKRLLAGVCIAAVLVGTQGMAEDTGVKSASNMTESTTPAMSVEHDLLQEVDQVEMLQQAIREVEFRLLNESNVEVAGDVSSEQTPVQEEASKPDSGVTSADASAETAGTPVAEATENFEVPGKSRRRDFCFFRARW